MGGHLAFGDGVSGVDLLQTTAIIVAAVGVVVTAVQLRHEARSAKKARQAELSWAMYVAYSDPEIRRARGRTETLANSSHCPASAREYQAAVADGWPWVDRADDSLDADIRRLLRFYNQLAVLLRQDLIDDEFVFQLIGTGLVSAWPALEPAVLYYQSFFGGAEGGTWQATPRALYDDVRLLHGRSAKWARRVVRQRPSTGVESK